jgi:predicted esterase
MQKLYTVLALAFTVLFSSFSSFGQSVLNPNDPIVEYNASNPPTQPPAGQIGKWVRTKKLSWNTDSWKAYIYNGIAFRLKFPKTYNPTANDGKQYPMIAFFHGVGESGPITDNEYSMYHGGSVFNDAVNNGVFDGYVIVMQSQGGFWGTPAYQALTELIDYMVANNKLDPFRVITNGLSGGGQGTWEMLFYKPTYIAAALPMSYTSIGYKDPSTVNLVKWTPIWNFQGGLDQSPAPSTSQQVRDAMLAAGGNYRYTEYPDLGHGTWTTAWAEPDFFPFVLRAHKANPWSLTGRTEFCPGEPVNATLGVISGFDAYEWRKDGVLISGATGNQITVTQNGTYDCRVKKGSVWSPWSPIPIQIKTKAPTVSPNIQVSGLASKVVPAPDGSTGVQLEVPANYVTYNWQRTDNTTVLSTTRYLPNATPGSYKVKVTEQFGCSSDFSAPFTVINANAPNGPDAPTNLSAAAISKTQIKLVWSDNPNPVYNESNFEVYQATAAGGPYKLIAFVGQDTTTYTINGLNANTTYYYKVRAINNNAGSATAGPASALTQADLTAPTAPANLRSGTITPNSVQLLWDAATDDVGVTNYDVYVNGIKSYSIGTQTSLTVYNLIRGQTYTFLVKARDLSGNASPFSNQIAVGAGYNGLAYKYYRGQWSTLPNFSTLTPVQTGNVPNVSLANRLDETNFGFLWEGIITIPVTGTYVFQTSSDDGSKIYIDTSYGYSVPSTVNNDGLHGETWVNSKTLTLTAGTHRFAATYFQQGGGYILTTKWKTPQTNNQFVSIPDSAFVEKIAMGPVPAAPSALTATAVAYNKVNLSWQDNSSNETGFEIYRSTTPAGPYAVIATVSANKKTFTDSIVQPSTTYYYRIKAIGQYGSSKFSDEGSSLLQYKYYETGSLSALPNFASLTPQKTGTINNFDLSIRNRSTQYAVIYDGFIKIPAAGTYTFYTSSDDGSNLYIDGTGTTNLVVNNDGLHGNQEKSGTRVLTAGLHAIRVAYFQASGDQVLTVSYSGPGISKKAIPDSVLNPPANATTFAAPGAPNIPTNFTATALSSSQIKLSWKDVGTNETGYQIYRSSNTNSNYALLATTDAGDSVTYIDDNLFANATYYYKVRAINATASSGFTPEIGVTTLNNAPVLAAIGNKSMRYGTQLQVTVSATDADNETLSTVISNLPAFGSFLSTGNGTATITFSPQAADQGVYNNITITVTDQHGGTATRSFNLTVNDNYNPVIAGTTTLSVNEGGTGSVSLNATDQNAGDAITWIFQNLPAFVTPAINGASVTLNAAPGYADNGVYNIGVTADDGRGGTDVKTVVLTVNNVNPNKKIYVNFNSGNTQASAPWNNTNKPPVQNDVYGPFKDETGASTTVSINVVTPWQYQNNGTNELGVSTGNNSGVYPDVVMNSAYFTGSGATQTFKLTGLDTASKYNLTFFGSRGGVSDDRTSVYTVKGTSVSLNAASNSKNTVTISNLKPDADNTLTVNLQSGGSSAYGYLNAMVIEKLFSDGTAPATPKDFKGTALPQGAASLSWTSVAYNEDGYQVYRSASAGGPFQQIGTTPAKASGYIDSTVAGNATYYYQVRAFNAQGTSAFTAVVAVAIPIKSPVVANIADQYMRGDQTLNIPVSATYGTSQSLTLTASNLPSFASFTDNGNATGTLVLKPSNTQLGVYSNITVTATDAYGGTSSKSFTLTVKDKAISSVYINFNEVQPEPWPWNSFNSAPAAGAAVTNAKDDINNNTGIAVTLLDSWSGSNNVGAVTGSNSGVFKDNVMSTAYYEPGSSTKRISITGLSTAKRYNLIFFASRGGVSDTRLTNYSVGNQTVSLNASGNTSNTVQINGLVPDNTGQILVNVAKDATSPYAYINAMVIQAYTYIGIPVAPANLAASSSSRNSIDLSWSDRSDNETAFEIWRSSTYNGTYTLLDTVPANTTKYTNKNLAVNSKYYYKVRAKAGTVFSDYTNVSGASVISFFVYVNFNRDNPAGLPWNNTNNTPQAGTVYSNLLSDQNTPTGINMTVGDNFSGINPYGMNTGNNSGIYPDNVIRSTWWLDVSSTATLTIDGLSQAMRYNFVFFGSRDGNGDNGDRTTTYSIGGNSVSLNCTDNISRTVQLNNVAPDQNGSVEIQIKAGGQSAYGYIGALVIQAANSADTATAVTPFSRTANTGKPKNTTAAATAVAAAVQPALVGDNTVKAYPNPFVSDITLRLSMEKAVDKLNVVLTDLSGNRLMLKELRNVPQGISQYQLNLGNINLAHGLYFIRVLGMPGGKDTVLRVMK